MEEVWNSPPGRLCRLCASSEQDGKFLYIFSDVGDYQDNLADLINISLPVTVSQIDPLPKQICQQCVEKLQATHEFALTCLNAEKELQDLLKNHELCARSRIRSPSLKAVDEASLKSAQTLPNKVKEPCKEETPLEKTRDITLSSAQCYDCPLCCDGVMGSCTEESTKLNVPTEVSEVNSLEEELMVLYNRVNKENDSSSSVVEDGSNSDEEDSMNKSEVDITISGDGDNDLEVASMKGISSGKPTLIKKQKRIGGKRKRKVGKYHPLTSKSLKQNPKLADGEESDTLIWIQGDSNEQSIPLVQCIHCSGWLPGYASCLQHSLTSHVNTSETEEKTFQCARCESVLMSCPLDLITHFKEVHCPHHDFEVEESDGQFTVIDKRETKNVGSTGIAKDIVYYCCICEKGFNWLLNLLKHSCNQVNCNDMYCSACDQHYRNRQRFVFHMNFHSEKAPALECDVCNQSFSNDNELYDHVRFAHITENVVCGECGKDFRSEKGLASHQLSAHNSDPSFRNRHKCTVCGKCYRDKQGLKEHLATHMSQKPYPCDKCDRAYNRYSRLKQHQMSHLYTDSMECYECTTCGLAFPDVDKAIVHSTAKDHEVQSVILDKIFRCEFCDEAFSCSDGLNQHRPNHVGEKPYECRICGSSFHTYSRVTTHKTTHGVFDQLEPRQGDFTIPRHFLCEHCGVSYPYWSYLQTHRKMHHSENPYSLCCKLCPEKFKNSWSLIYHRKKVHDQNGSVKEWRKRTVQCPHCGVNCMYQHTLNMHIERKHGGSKDEDNKRKIYMCEECGKVFKYQSSLLLHQKMHLGQKNFSCEECHKAFLTMSTLKNHSKRCHQGIKPHQCEYCGKAFFHRIARDDHLRVHTGEKPFQCQFCEKQFRLKSMLTDHSKIHSDHRPYPCDICGQSFRRMVHMRQHRTLHTGEKPFKCSFCGQEFRLKQEIYRHMKTKHAETSVDNVEEDEFIFGN